MSSLKFGTAIRDITPTRPDWAHGYSARTKKSSGVREPIEMGCLAVTDGKTKVLLFAMDIIGVPDTVCEELYDYLEKETGVGYPNILISGSHTHFAPALHGTAYTGPDEGFVDRDEEYVDSVKRRMVEAAKEALDAARPMELQTARVQVPQVIYNRRTVRKSDGMVDMNLTYPEDPSPYNFSPVDSELTVHRLLDADGVRSVMLNFGCHPVTGCSPDEDYYRFSSDYPYYARQTIIEKWRCPVLFTLGAAGDAVPINRKEDCRERIGSTLGNAAILAERTYQQDDSDVLATDFVEIEAETILKTDPPIAEAAYEAARKAVLAIKDRESKDYRERLRTFQERLMLCGRARRYPENRHRIKVQFIQIGETVFVVLGFEVLAEIGLKMKERFPNSVMISCAGGYAGYLPLAHEYERVGYEATESSTHFVPGTADRILDAILKKLDEGMG